MVLFNQLSKKNRSEIKNQRARDTRQRDILTEMSTWWAQQLLPLFYSHTPLPRCSWLSLFLPLWVTLVFLSARALLWFPPSHTFSTLGCSCNLFPDVSLFAEWISEEIKCWMSSAPPLSLFYVCPFFSRPSSLVFFLLHVTQPCPPAQQLFSHE